MFGFDKNCNCRITMPIVVGLFLLLAGDDPASAQDHYSIESGQIEAYLEPIKRIEVSSVETGIIESIQVREGDRVTHGQTLVRLDRSLLQKSLEVAEAEANSLGNLKMAQAEWKLQQSRYAMLKDIVDRGHGRNSELERAAADLEAAAGRVLRAEEEIAIRRKQQEQIQARLHSRDILSPIEGLVVEIHKNPGEAVSPNSPVLVTVVDIDQLKCVFHVPRHQASVIRNNQPITLRSASHPRIEGKVQWKSPIVDAESETVKVIVRVENQGHVYTSGDYCLLQLPTTARPAIADDETNRTIALDRPDDTDDGK